MAEAAAVARELRRRSVRGCAARRRCSSRASATALSLLARAGARGARARPAGARASARCTRQVAARSSAARCAPAQPRLRRARAPPARRARRRARARGRATPCAPPSTRSRCSRSRTRSRCSSARARRSSAPRLRAQLRAQVLDCARPQAHIRARRTARHGHALCRAGRGARPRARATPSCSRARRSRTARDHRGADRRGAGRAAAGGARGAARASDSRCACRSRRGSARRCSRTRTCATRSALAQRRDRLRAPHRGPRRRCSSALYTGMSAMMDIVDPRERMPLNLEVEQLARRPGRSRARCCARRRGSCSITWSSASWRRPTRASTPSSAWRAKPARRATCGACRCSARCAR